MSGLSEREIARPKVPSLREQQQGKPVPEARFERAVQPRLNVSRREMLVAYLDGLRPSRVIGEANPFPMFLLALIGLLDAIEGGGGILFPEIIREFHIQLVQLVVLNSAIGIPVVLIGLPGGYVADRVNRVRLYFVAKLIQGLAVVGVGASKGLGQWSLAQAVGVTNFGGVTAAFSSPARDSLLADYYPTEMRGTVYGILFLGILGGQVVGPLMAGALGDHFGWRFPYIVLGAFGTCVAFLAFFLREPARGMQDRLASGADPLAALRQQKPAGFWESWRAVYSVATIRRLYVAQVAWNVGGTMFGTVLIYNLATRYHVPAVTRGLSVSIGTTIGLLAITLTMPYVNALIARAPGQVMGFMGAISIINCVVFFAGVGFQSAAVGLIEIVLLSAINAPFFPARSALLSLVIPARVRAFGFKADVPFTLLSLILGPGAVALGEAGGPQFGVLVGVPIYLAGALVVLTGAVAVNRDIRAARASAMAEEESLRARGSGREKLLVCRDLDVHYGQVQVIFNVDFDVERGEIVALLGTNGAGKSTLLRALTGLTQASNGAVFFDGEDVTHAPPHVVARKGVVLMSGGRGIFPGLTVADNFKAAAWLAGVDQEGLRRQTARVLDEFFPALRERLGQKAGTLSGGEQQMLGLGMAFLMRADLLLIDELSLGLSPAIVKRLLEAVAEVNRAGTTVILVEQSVEVALSVAGRAVVLEKGEVAFSGSAAELREHPEVLRSLFLASAGRGGGLLGAPARPELTETGRPEPVLRVEELTVRHGGIRAVDSVSLEAGRGEVVGLIGPNGAGKTTLFDAITGFATAERGRVVFAGRDVTRLSPTARARLGLVRSFQDARLFPSMTVRENLLTALERHSRAGSALTSALWLPSVRRQEVRLGRRADQLIELFELHGHEDRFVTELSTGVHRVVDLACVMAADPDILLLDEPSAGLSQAETEEMGPLLLRLRRETGLGLVVIEHDIKLITSISDHVVALDLGRVIAQGPPGDVIGDPSVVRSYLGAAAETAGGVG